VNKTPKRAAAAPITALRNDDQSISRLSFSLTS
jgi:hypothetical protein